MYASKPSRRITQRQQHCAAIVRGEPIGMRLRGSATVGGSAQQRACCIAANRIGKQGSLG
jgi:hypothetical protein